jgi:hypothetical protein
VKGLEDVAPREGDELKKMDFVNLDPIPSRPAHHKKE